ncbi:ABC transporter ATP-binding protein [Streptomyces ficellus]|uniref:ABC transporter ATP-binding protein n=1 Tax=Streptomyces ficellus TaxID=1977088 RepID=A0ABT7Z954_9ACTN|nr:ABC transporter ATP-binding protein [Streptomyces ficellus]MDN3296027.1 ABC transporter ATP-binding protein [Streptomyces ficellus]
MRCDPLLSVRDLRVAFGAAEAVRGLSFDVREGEVFALVGESGAGKSLTARSLLGMAPREATIRGSVRLRPATRAGAGAGDGERAPATAPGGIRPPGATCPGATSAGAIELVGAKPSVLAPLWGRRIAFVPQDSLSALSPVHPVGDQLAAAVRSVQGLSRRHARVKAAEALERVGIPAARARAYPHEFSGGMRQRAVIAMAMVNEPDLVVADEPTTALDPEMREQALRLLGEQREATGAALVLVTHDLEAVRDHADRVLVVYAGRHVESGPVRRVFAHPRAPYTAGLLASLPPDEPVPGRGRRLPAMGRTPCAPDRGDEAAGGCPFAPRCPLSDARCRAERPEPQPVDGRDVSCHHWSRLPESPADVFLEKA